MERASSSRRPPARPRGHPDVSPGTASEAGVRYVCIKDGSRWLPPELLEEALSAAFQASLTAEESRPTRFRLLLTAPEQLPVAGTPRQGVLRLSFDEQWPLTAEQLRRLAPAVPFETSLSGVHAVRGELRIRGVAHSGPHLGRPRCCSGLVS